MYLPPKPLHRRVRRAAAPALDAVLAALVLPIVALVRFVIVIGRFIAPKMQSLATTVALMAKAMRPVRLLPDAPGRARRRAPTSAEIAARRLKGVIEASRRSAAAAVMVVAALLGTTAAIGEQSALAARETTPAGVAALLRAPDAPAATALAAVQAGKGAALMTTVSRPEARVAVDLPSLVAATDARTTPRATFAKPRSAAAARLAKRRPAAARLAATRAATAPAGASAADAPLLTAYAPERVDIAAPFALLLDQGPAIPAPALVPALPPSVSGLDHWWSDRPLPRNATSEKSVRCLAEAVYFEARGESERGQAAVAQVVVNRVKNPAYPYDVCDVVYQNRNWFNRCQFTFACDRTKDAIADKAAFDRATEIARAYLKGELWLPEIGAATHYHTTDVAPAWRTSMRAVKTIDRHIFYMTINGGWS